MIVGQTSGLDSGSGWVGDGLAASGGHHQGASGVADHDIDGYLNAPATDECGIAGGTHGGGGDHQQGHATLLELLEATERVDQCEHRTTPE